MPELWNESFSRAEVLPRVRIRFREGRTFDCRLKGGRRGSNYRGARRFFGRLVAQARKMGRARAFRAGRHLILWAIIVKLMIEEGGIFVGSMLLMLVAGVVLLSFLTCLRSERKMSPSSRLNQQQRLREAEETAKILPEPNLEMAISVTEHTTAKLGESVIPPMEKPQSN